MSYVQFHEYLIKNLKNETNYGWKPVWLDVGEGLYKTVILHYASVVELVLFTLAEQHYDSNKSKSPDGVLACFKRTDRKYQVFSSRKIRVDDDNQHTKLYTCRERDLDVDPPRSGTEHAYQGWSRYGSVR
jgi:hypothetical protein